MRFDSSYSSAGQRLLMFWKSVVCSIDGNSDDAKIIIFSICFIFFVIKLLKEERKKILRG
jgi:hypothetical protein